MTRKNKKRLLLCSILAVIVLFVPLTPLGVFRELNSEEIIKERAEQKRRREILNNPRKFDLSDTSVIRIINTYSEKYHVVTVTTYHPTVKECDGDPLRAAHGIIDTALLNSNQLRWCALSQDLVPTLTNKEPKFHYEDKFKVTINGETEIWELHDTMNKRWSDRMDLLLPVGQKGGKWTNILIEKVN